MTLNTVNIGGLNIIFISILIPVYDDIEGLEITIQSLNTNKLLQRQDTEIIICNDAGGKEISQIAENYGVREVRLTNNSGSYAARNLGIVAAKGEVLIFLDADQRIDENWLDAGLNALSSTDYVGGKIVVETMNNSDIWELYDQTRAFPISHYLQNKHFAPTANLFVRRKVFEKVGLFRSELRSGGDYEFGIRVRNAGFIQKYEPNAITYHKARNRKEQFRKIQRVAKGVIEVKILFLDESSLKIISTSFLTLIKVPFEAIWRIFKSLFVNPKLKQPNHFRFILIEKSRKFLQNYWLFIGSVDLLFKNDFLRNRT